MKPPKNKAHKPTWKIFCTLVYVNQKFSRMQKEQLVTFSLQSDNFWLYKGKAAAGRLILSKQCDFVLEKKIFVQHPVTKRPHISVNIVKKNCLLSNTNGQENVFLIYESRIVWIQKSKACLKLTEFEL